MSSKKCLLCLRVEDNASETCHACGEATWEPVAEATAPVPITTEEPVPSKRGKR